MMYDENMIRPMREEMDWRQRGYRGADLRKAWSAGRIEGAIEVDPVRRDPSDD